MSKVKAISVQNQINSINKYYNMAKVLLILAPFIGLTYLSMESGRMGMAIPQAIQENPRLTVMFLVSMINPFIGYLLIFAQRKISENDIEYAVVNIVMFIISEILLQNILYIILFAFILYKTIKVYKVTIKDSFQKKLKDGFLMTISGSLVVIALASLCLFATIRINM